MNAYDAYDLSPSQHTDCFTVDSVKVNKGS